MWPDIALCLWSLAPRLAPQISLAALTLGISAAHASPMHDPASNFHPVRLNRVFLRSAMASPDTTSGMASAPQTEPSHHRDRISWCRRLQQPASPWRSPVHALSRHGLRGRAVACEDLYPQSQTTAAVSAPGALPPSAFSQRHSARRQRSVMAPLCVKRVVVPGLPVCAGPRRRQAEGA